ncbi:MAG: hypothetical protein IKW49_09075 [Opitutales bacterium]|nr:hypothetical protein [Opitutales bacterium]
MILNLGVNKNRVALLCGIEKLQASSKYMAVIENPRLVARRAAPAYGEV